MEIDTYLLAGKRVEIVSQFPDVHVACRNYRCAGQAEFRVQAGEEEIARVRADLERQRERLGLPPREAEDGCCEFYAIHRLLAERLLDDGVLLMHASCVAMDGWAYLFTAVSGTGKSTHAGYWRECFGARAVVLNDDTPMVRLTDSGAIAYGTPWSGKHGINTNASAPVRGICLLERSAENFIEPISPRDAFPTLYRQCYHMVAEPRAKLRVLSLVDALSRTVSIYRLGVNMSPEAARVAWEGMNGGIAL